MDVITECTTLTLKHFSTGHSVPTACVVWTLLHWDTLLCDVRAMHTTVTIYNKVY